MEKSTKLLYHYNCIMSNKKDAHKLNYPFFILSHYRYAEMLKKALDNNLVPRKDNLFKKNFKTWSLFNLDS